MRTYDDMKISCVIRYFASWVRHLSALFQNSKSEAFFVELETWQVECHGESRGR